MKFRPQEGAAIAELLSNRTLEQAAEAVGIGVTTLRRWMWNREFKDCPRRRSLPATVAASDA